MQWVKVQSNLFLSVRLAKVVAFEHINQTEKYAWYTSMISLFNLLRELKELCITISHKK